MTIRENPYSRLKRVTQQWIADNVIHRHRKLKWTLEISKKYSFIDVGQIVKTADDLGYVIEITISDCGKKYHFWYVKKLPDRVPYHLS